MYWVLLEVLVVAVSVSLVFCGSKKETHPAPAAAATVPVQSAVEATPTLSSDTTGTTGMEGVPVDPAACPPPEAVPENVAPNETGQLTVNKQELRFEYDEGHSTFQISNSNSKHFAITSNNALYTVSPAASFLKAQKSMPIAVVRKKGLWNNDKLVIQYADASGATDIKAFWASNPAGMQTIEVKMSRR